MPVSLTYWQEICNEPIMENCPFCQIIAHKIPAVILYEDELAIVIQDLHPLTPVHILVIPKEHIASMNEVIPEQSDMLGQLLLLARKIAFEQSIGTEGYRIVINTGVKGGQTVFHLHIHVLGGAPIETNLLTRGLQ
ncbi:MAG: histidine triad nucleotide-binding protein [Anaerolineaceae bacterium]